MYVTNKERTDGFGAQYQTIIFSILFAELEGLDFAYKPFSYMEHNYDSDPLFLEKKENLINIKGNYVDSTNISHLEILPLDLSFIYNQVESNIDLCLSSPAFSKIKNLFYQNKQIHKKSDGKTVSIHIRRQNKFDIGDYGYTEDEYFLNAINTIRKEYSDIKKIKIYSQGDVENFKKYVGNDIEFHLDESIEKTFTDLVFSDILIMSKGSFSYCAGLLSDAIVYYLPFWHKPKSTWLKF